MPVSPFEILLILALAGLTFMFWRKNKALRHQLDELEIYSYKRFAELGDDNDRLVKTVTNLKKQVRLLSGTRFTPDMTVEEALEVHPRVQDVLSGANITGGCGCHDDGDDLFEQTLEEVAQAHNANLPQLLTTLNALSEGKMFVPPVAPASKGPIQIQMAQNGKR